MVTKLKTWRKTQSVIMLALTVSSLAVTATPAFADDTNNDDSNKQETTNKGIEYGPGQTKINAAIKAAKDAGYDVKVNKKVETTTEKDPTDKIKEITNDQDKQATDLEAAVKKAKAADDAYNKANDAYNKANDAYNTQVNAHKGETPKSTGEVDGAKVNIYGDYDENQKGSYKYYDKFDATIDLSNIPDAKVFSKAGYFDDSKLSVVKGADKKIYTQSDVSKEWTRLAGPEFSAKDTGYIKNPKAGDTYLLTNAGVDAITGDKYDLVTTITDTLKGPEGKNVYTSLKRKGADSVCFDTIGTKGLKTTQKFIKHGSDPLDAKNKTKVFLGFVSVDIDSNQGGETNMGNLAVLNPKDSDVKVDGDKFENISGASYDNDASAPKGTIAMYGFGDDFTYNIYSDKTRTVDPDTRDPKILEPFRVESLGTGSKLNAAVKPVKPVKPKAPKLEANVTDLLTVPEGTKDVQAGETDGTGDSIDGKELKQDDKITYVLKTDDLPANRVTDIKTMKWHDELPDGVKYEDAKAYTPVNSDDNDDSKNSDDQNADNKDSKQTLKANDDQDTKNDDSKDNDDSKKNDDNKDAKVVDDSKQWDFKNDGQVVDAVGKDSYLATLNKDKSVAKAQDYIVIHATVGETEKDQDLKNVATATINDDDVDTNEVDNSVKGTPAEKIEKKMVNTGMNNLISQMIEKVMHTFQK